MQIYIQNQHIIEPFFSGKMNRNDEFLEKFPEKKVLLCADFEYKFAF